MRGRRAALFGVGLCAVLVGCASLLGIDDGKPYPPDGSDTDGTGGSDALTDSMTMKEAAPVPDVNVEANSATCDDFTRVLDMGGVFLAPTGVDNGTCSMAQPCRSLSAQILQLAVTRAKPIYLLEGDYPYALDLTPVGTVSLVVEGGWMLDGGKWDSVCDFNKVTIHGTKLVDTNQGATAAYVTPGSSLTLRLVSVAADPAGTASSYGLFANQSATVTLEAVKIVAGGAGGGGNGMPGSGADQPVCYVGSGGTGAPGGPGQPGDGVYTPFGYHPSQGLPGSIGDAGGGGTAGGAGSSGTCAGCEAGSAIDPDGSITMTCTTTQVSGQSTAGGPGCGGGGGYGGFGGTTGGASIAVYVTGSGTLILKSGTKLITQIGASGGSGGNGAAGGTGATGSYGMPFFNQACSMLSTCQAGSVCLEGGVGGSPGGAGGTGGQGGGGAGGPSVTIVRQSTVKVLDGSVQLGFNSGGDGGAPNGQSGDQQPEMTF